MHYLLVILTFFCFSQVQAVAKSLSDRLNGTWCSEDDGYSFLLREASEDVEDFKSSQICITFKVKKSFRDFGVGRSFERYQRNNSKVSSAFSGYNKDGVAYDPSLFSYFTSPNGTVEVHIVDVADKTYAQLYLKGHTDVSGYADRLQGVVLEHGESDAREGLSGHIMLSKTAALTPDFDELWQKLDRLAHQGK